MGEVVEQHSVAHMPRGGPTASWLDRRMQTDVLEYTDRYAIPDEVKAGRFGPTPTSLVFSRSTQTSAKTPEPKEPS